MCVTLTGLSRPVGVSLRLLLSKVVRLYEALKARARPFGVGTGFGSARGSVGSSRLYFISYLLPVAVPCGVRIRIRLLTCCVADACKRPSISRNTAIFHFVTLAAHGVRARWAMERCEAEVSLGPWAILILPARSSAAAQGPGLRDVTDASEPQPRRDSAAGCTYALNHHPSPPAPLGALRGAPRRPRPGSSGQRSRSAASS